MTGLPAHPPPMETTRTTTLPFTADDPRATFGRSVGLASQVIAAVRPDQMGGPTPCSGMDVRQLLAHLVMVLQRVAALGRGEDPFDLPAVEPAGAGGVDAWSAAAHRVQDAWTDDAVLDREMTLPWIQAPGRIVLLGYVSEVTVHTWDLATATGQSYDFIHAGLPAADRQAIFDAAVEKMPPELRTFDPPFADAVPVPADAPMIDRLVAWTGRSAMVRRIPIERKGRSR